MMHIQAFFNRLTRRARLARARRRRWKSADPRLMPQAWRAQ